MQLHEKYRPRSLDELAGQAQAVKQLRCLADGPMGGESYWLSGPSGTGKTTIARIIAGMVADDSWITELDATELTATRLRDVEQFMRCYGGGKGGRAFIVNEAHGLRSDAIRKLLTMLEPLPDHVCWIFTTTKDGQDALFADEIDAHPLLSRCVVIPLTSQGLATPGAEYVQRVARAEGLDGQPIAKYVRLVHDCHGNLRQALQRVKAGAMIGGGS